MIENLHQLFSGSTMLTANEAKLIAIVALSFSSFFAGILPVILGLGSRCQKSVPLSVVLCFGGGVLFATSVVHILPETREPLAKWAEVVFCSGFFGIYLLDVLVQLLNRNRNDIGREERPSDSGEGENLLNSQVADYGTAEENAPPPNPRERSPSIVSGVISYSSMWDCTSLGLLLAFSVHAILEGLVIGVQSSSRSVLLLLGAVLCHKLVVTFCLGAELSRDGRTLCSVIPPISIYVLGSAVGIGIGMLVHSTQENSFGLVIPVLQGLAGGTLLYIVVSEILPRERNKDLPLSAAPLQFLSLVIGFAVMVLLTFYVTDDT